MKVSPRNGTNDHRSDFPSRSRSLHAQRCRMHRARMLGGSSCMNAGIYNRGNHKDYDNWADLGNTGWSFDDLLPLFLRAENFLVHNITSSKHVIGTRDATYHRSGEQHGYFPVSHTYNSELLPAFIEAGRSLGFPYNPDHNGATQNGFGKVQVAAQGGVRHSTARAYLTPVRRRKNLHVVLNTPVSKIPSLPVIKEHGRFNELYHVPPSHQVVIDEKTMTAKGVEYLTEDGTTRFVSAGKEVIMSAGAFATPQILMLSGIGPEEELQKHGIRTVVNLPVGENMQSHAGPGGLYFSIEKEVGFFLPRLFTSEFLTRTIQFLARGDGPFTTASGFEGIAFVNTSYERDPDWPDIELFFGTLTIGTDEGLIYRRRLGLTEENKYFTSCHRLRLPPKAWKTYSGLLRKPGFEIFPYVMRPKSRGKVLLRSTNVLDRPKIFGNFFDHPDDVRRSIEAIRLVLKLGDQPSFKKLGAKFYSRPLPGCRHLKQFTDRYWECHMRHFTFLIWHDVGTCKMGPPSDRKAVVDPKLRVYGVQRLRVADASIMPVITTGHPMGTCIVIGEKASDIIKSHYDL
ncbi:unnamed protein product [Darwinula stevensoni]|uniref:Glucose-methanol-choline oxidoreductase N-terminal domain-containing protein n=1 Tax=Darwinula stevensoni TaxID=69355 RepID=A0A7R9A3P9_9CRUS|nr:unnamed protein product [Darwinula stevensoni]CAG0891067.1 unnamed protein product [Darwinula stevensoni]